MEIIVTSILAFAATNLDDIFILTLFYGNKKFSGREIILGQLAGISVLIALSLLGSLIGLVVDVRVIGLLGLIPILVGLKGLWVLVQPAKHDDQDTLAAKGNNNILAVAGVTIANGGDNVGIYIPLFATLTVTSKVVMISTFFIMTLLWCLMAKYFVRHPLIEKTVDRYGHFITPFVLILLGLFILHESGIVTI